MMNKYVRIAMTPSIYGNGGSFVTTADIEISDIKSPFIGGLVKIDTGCGISMIPLQKWGVHKKLCEKYKYIDIQNNVSCVATYGVETGGMKHKDIITDQDKMDSPALKFRHSTTLFKVGGMDLRCPDIHVNYDRKGNALIGMDILKDWDIHIGTSIKTGETIFLGCPKKQINDGYLNALEDEFGIISEAEASLCRKAIEKGDIPLEYDEPIFIPGNKLRRR